MSPQEMGGALAWGLVASREACLLPTDALGLGGGQPFWGVTSTQGGLPCPESSGGMGLGAAWCPLEPSTPAARGPEER